uniref:Uncharacterized protein n=1 Tax=Setaria italica TaxID=4555 RepID=K4A1F3_SETIT
EEGVAVGCGEEVVVELEDAVKLLVEHLVLPALPRGTLLREEALEPEKQETVARQMHATVLLYNYYHRKQFPQLEFADPERFCMTASLTAGDALLVYLNQVHDHHGNGAGDGLSVTDKAVIEACDIAEALDATKDSPEMTMWPISKVAVLLLDRTKKMCLLEHGSETKGVFSLLEKDIKSALGGSRSSDLSVKESTSKSVVLPSEPLVLQQIAYSEVELKTGINRTSLRFLEEHRVYSLSKKGTTTMLFVMQYDQTVNSKLKEMPIEVLIDRMSGPVFRRDPYLATTNVVECYHVLPYKEVVLNIQNREWPLDCLLSVPDVDPVTKNHALESQKEKVAEKSGGITGSMNNVQKYATLQLLQKMRDDSLRELCKLGDRSAQYEMEIQTILTEGEMTPKVTSILKKYENSWNKMEEEETERGHPSTQQMPGKKPHLMERPCRNWMTYAVTATGFFQDTTYFLQLQVASVYLTGPDFVLSADEDSKVTPHEARDAAASNMLYQLRQKAMES